MSARNKQGREADRLDNDASQLRYPNMLPQPVKVTSPHKAPTFAAGPSGVSAIVLRELDQRKWRSDSQTIRSTAGIVDTIQKMPHTNVRVQLVDCCLDATDGFLTCTHCISPCGLDKVD